MATGVVFLAALARVVAWDSDLLTVPIIGQSGSNNVELVSPRFQELPLIYKPIRASRYGC